MPLWHDFLMTPHNIYFHIMHYLSTVEHLQKCTWNISETIYWNGYTILISSIPYQLLFFFVMKSSVSRRWLIYSRLDFNLFFLKEFEKWCFKFINWKLSPITWVVICRYKKINWLDEKINYKISTVSHERAYLCLSWLWPTARQATKVANTAPPTLGASITVWSQTKGSNRGRRCHLCPIRLLPAAGWSESPAMRVVGAHLVF